MPRSIENVSAIGVSLLGQSALLFRERLIPTRVQRVTPVHRETPTLVETMRGPSGPFSRATQASGFDLFLRGQLHRVLAFQKIQSRTQP